MRESAEIGSFEEYLRAPGWAFALLGIMLGITSGGLTAVGVRSLTDEPLLSGGQAALFFICFAIASALILYVMLNATLQSVRADSTGLEVKLGILGAGATWTWETVSSVDPTTHNVLRHGGRGNVFAPSSRRAWTMIGISTGVEFAVTNPDGTSNVYFVSSRRGEELVAFINKFLAET